MTIECFCSFFRMIWGIFLQYLRGLAKMETRKISILFSISIFITNTCAAVNTINATHLLRDGETLVSSGGKFQLGFFTPGSSSRRYVGIWYMKVSVCTVVWVANRKIPLVDSTGVLAIRHLGVLVLINGTNHVIWSTNSSRSTSLQNPVAQLFDSEKMELIWIARYRAENRKQQEDLLLFDFKIIVEATDNFSEDKMLGRAALDQFIRVF
ncbi:hypothetical protein Ancab_039694 [Ancistrocladus abbreviatus]